MRVAGGHGRGGAPPDTSPLRPCSEALFVLWDADMQRVLAVLCLCLVRGFPARRFARSSRTRSARARSRSPAHCRNHPVSTRELDAQRLDHIRYPHPCWKDVTGLTSDWVLAVDRAGTMRLFVYGDPTDGIVGVVRALLQDGRTPVALSEVPLESESDVADEHSR